jgi:Fe-S oxidoreductase/nitrate reductase gamma subunit
MNEVSREILWNIPTGLKYSMYFLLIIASAVFAFGLKLKFDYITRGKSWKEILPSKLNWESLFKTIAFQGKIVRDPYVGVFHSLIFYGFLILWIATDLVAIHFDTPFQVFKGTTYIIISFLADIAGLAILVGLSLAFYRRYILKPSYLSSTHPNREKFMYAMLTWLVVAGFLLEGLRLLGTGMPSSEQLYSPIGWIIATSLGALNLSDTVLALSYRVLWFLHMLNTMIFIASIPFSKFSHILFGPLNALLTPYRRAAVLNPMNFEDESKETFGLGKTSELTMKQRLDTLSCVECGRCTQVCPANLSDKPLDPKKIVTKLRDVMNEPEPSFKVIGADINLWDNPLYSSNELDSCTTCGACMEECPMNIEHVSLIMDLKRYKALTLGELPPAAADAVNKIKINGNPWGISHDDRFKWADGLDVPVAEKGKKIDYLYYVGCAGSFDANNQKVVKDTVMLLKKAGVSFAVMGKTEKCNGDPIRRFGDEYSFFEVAIENIARMREYSFDKVVTHCPHCLHTIGKEYAKFEQGSFETIHHTKLLSDLLVSGKLKPTKVINESLTFHDPCYLGRHHNEYDAPRNVLTAIPGLKLIEMEKNKDKSLCCGMGGGNMWYELPEGKNLALNRLEHIAETKSEKLATSCSFCMINFNSSKGQVPSTQDLQVEDVAQILARSVE